MVATAAGFPLVLVGGVLSGVFSMPLKAIKGWNWENMWLPYCLWGATIFPLILCFSTVKSPGVVFDNIRDVYVCLCGLGWGIGSVLFGLGLVYVGNALTFGITLSLSSTVGSILPLLIFQIDSAGKLVTLFYWAGLLVAIAGVAILSWAGMTKEKELKENISLDENENDDNSDPDNVVDVPSDESDSAGYSESESDGDDDDDEDENGDCEKKKKKKKREKKKKCGKKTEGVQAQSKRSKMQIGIIICVVSGVFSAMLNVGLACGDPVRVKAEEKGAPKYVSNAPVWFLAICSGNFVNLGYAIYLLFKNKSWVKYREQPLKVFLLNFFITFCMGVMWFGGLLVYGIGTIVIGDLGTSVGWPMYMVAMVLSSNIGAILLGEWKGTKKKSRIRMGIGLGFLAVAIVLLALKSSLDDYDDGSSSNKYSPFSSDSDELLF